MEFDAETRELTGLDDMGEILGEIDEAPQVDIEEMEQQAATVKAGNVDIEDADDVIEEVSGNERGSKTNSE